MHVRRVILCVLAAATLVAGGCKKQASPPEPSPAKAPAAPAPALDVSKLPVSKGLPDPLRSQSGQQVKTREQWERRRQEIRALLERYQYGQMPPAPGNVRLESVSAEVVFNGQAEKRMLSLSMGPQQRIRFSLGLYLPAGGGPFPVILHIDHRKIFGIDAAEALVRRGYLLVGYDPTFLDPDQPGVQGPAQAAYPHQDWATLAVWAWGASRILDYLITLKQVDGSRVAVTGHSRSGKAALLAGAFDQRFALVAPQGSGCGGAACYRHKGGGTETLQHITQNFPHWFVPRLRAFVGKEQHLPFDQHFLLALVAPRALLSIDALEDRWADPPGTQRAYEGARPVFQLLGAATRQGIHFRQGKHELTKDDWLTLADFADRVFKEAASPTDRKSAK